MMLNSPREKKLAWILGGSLLVVVLAETAGQLILQPIQDAGLNIETVRAQNATLQEQADTVEHSLRNLRQLHGRSLPADPGKASVLYQGWLIRRLDENSIDSVIVTPGPPIVEKRVGYRIPFSVQAEGTSASIAMFLDQFYATPLLHRITNLNITGASSDDDDCRLTMSLEAIALDSAHDVHDLPEPIEISNEMSLAVMIAEKDFMGSVSRETAPLPLATVNDEQPTDTDQSDPPATVIDPRSSIRFVASVWNGQQREAWFVDHRTKTERSVVAAGDLSFPDINGRILRIGVDTLDVEFEGRPCALRLGQTLADADADAPNSR